ncbi:Fic family protein [Companilactobacillus sp. DQM5]|uniref:Fic family protein n=1 Tax=Companilactobacillus sp. DQM5 TaxID=3463359 RepID=UPI004058DEBF
MDLKDKYEMTPEQNKRFARSNFTKLVHTNSRFEGVNTTLPQTQTIMDGLGVSGVSTDDIETIVNLKRGWQYVTESKEPFTIEFQKNINKIVAARDSLDPGQFRSEDAEGGVNIGSDDFTPPPFNEEKEKNYFDKLMLSDISTTEKALTLMYHNMRGQLFWDGNKRTATLAANKIMIDGGAGLINVPLNKWEEWNTKITEFYKSGNMENIKKWTYEYGIQGINL